MYIFNEKRNKGVCYISFFSAKRLNIKFMRQESNIYTNINILYILLLNIFTNVKDKYIIFIRVIDISWFRAFILVSRRLYIQYLKYLIKFTIVSSYISKVYLARRNHGGLVFSSLLNY